MSLLALLDMLGMLHWIIYYNTAKYKQQVAQTLNAEIQCKLNNLFSHFKQTCFIKIFIFQTSVHKNYFSAPFPFSIPDLKSLYRRGVLFR